MNDRMAASVIGLHQDITSNTTQHGRAAAAAWATTADPKFRLGGPQCIWPHQQLACMFVDSGCGQLILRKISKTGATHQVLDFKAKMHQIRFPTELCARPRWRSL